MKFLEWKSVAAAVAWLSNSERDRPTSSWSKNAYEASWVGLRRRKHQLKNVATPSAIFDRGYRTATEVKSGGHGSRRVAIRSSRNLDDRGGFDALKQAEYRNEFKPDTGQFVANWNMKDDDERFARTSTPAAPNSEIIWTQFRLALDALRDGDVDAEHPSREGVLRSLLRKSIINHETLQTIFWCDDYKTGGTRLSRDTEGDADDFAALLGTPNGRSAAWLVMQHGISMDARGIESISYRKGELEIGFDIG